MALELGHKGLTETHDLGVALALGVEVGAALAAAHGKTGQTVLENLFKAKEFNNGQVDAGVEAQAALIGADGGIELDAEAAVYLDGALVVHPGHSKLDHTLRLHDALKDARLLQLGTLLHDRLEGLQHFAHSLEEFRLMGIFLLHGGIDVLQVSTFKFHVAKPLCMACSPKKWRLPKCVGSIIRRQAPECKRKMKTCSLNP